MKSICFNTYHDMDQGVTKRLILVKVFVESIFPSGLA